METERRKGLRIEVKWPIVLTRGLERIEGETLNLSQQGISFCSEDPIRLKETYQILLRPPNHSEVAISGQITWSDLYGMDRGSNTYCMGVCFLEIPEQDGRFIKDAIRDHLV